jgi:hypothetical protein
MAMAKQKKKRSRGRERPQIICGCTVCGTIISDVDVRPDFSTHTYDIIARCHGKVLSRVVTRLQIEDREDHGMPIILEMSDADENARFNAGLDLITTALYPQYSYSTRSTMTVVDYPVQNMPPPYGSQIAAINQDVRDMAGYMDLSPPRRRADPFEEPRYGSTNSRYAQKIQAEEKKAKAKILPMPTKRKLALDD